MNNAQYVGQILKVHLKIEQTIIDRVIFTNDILIRLKIKKQKLNTGQQIEFCIKQKTNTNVSVEEHVRNHEKLGHGTGRLELNVTVNAQCLRLFSRRQVLNHVLVDLIKVHVQIVQQSIGVLEFGYLIEYGQFEHTPVGV